MTDNIPTLPFHTRGVLDIPAQYDDLRAQGPAVRVRTPAGDLAWLVCRYDIARTLFSDSRLVRSHPDPEHAARISDAGIMSGPTGDPATEAEDHARLRRVLGPALSKRRMNTLRERIRSLTEHLIEDMITAHDGAEPVDLHACLAEPLPVLVICELLGVPYSDRGYFRGLSDRANVMFGDDPKVAIAELRSYAHTLAESKRRQPAEDLLSDLVAAQRDDPGLTDDKIAHTVSGVLFAGHETTVKRIGMGVVLLDREPQVRRRLATDPGCVATVVEEILRLAAPDDLGVARYATADITVSSQNGDNRSGDNRSGDNGGGGGGAPFVIPRGDAVILASAATNRDPDVFPDPNRFDPDRSPNPHLAFGSGGHFCLGQALARTELSAVFTLLPRRLPRLRVAVEHSALHRHTERLTGGLETLPVTW